MIREAGMPHPERMLAARLHGPSDLRIDEVTHPGPPGPGCVLLKLKATGLCGSDLHSYLDARIGDTVVKSPLILGHEFSAVVEDTSTDAVDGNFQRLQPGARVAVDPAQPCGQCPQCMEGNPNLCGRIRFCGNYPHNGSLCQWMHMPARCCFPVPDSVDDAAAALVEPLGVAIHAVDLAHVRIGTSAAIIGAGPIGLLILQSVKIAGAGPVFVSDSLEWRLELARKYSGIPVRCGKEDAAARILEATGGLGAGVVFEAAWGGTAVQQAAEMAQPGGRLVLVGIPSDDRLELQHSIARRKGLTVVMCRRMRHAMPRALQMVERGLVDVGGLVSHRFPLERAPEAFQLNVRYEDNVTKVIIDNEK